jgi:undecaprenyl-diphosphatase
MAATETEEPAWERSPSDLLRLVVAAIVLVVLLVLEALFGDTLVKFAHDSLRGFDAVPSWIVTLVVGAARVLAIIFLTGGLIATFVRTRARWRFAAVIALAGAVAAVISVVFEQHDTSAQAQVVATTGLFGRSFPTAAGVAFVAAIVTAAAPWLPRRWRRIAWALVITLTLARVLVAPIAFDTVRALVVGWFVGAAALVIAGGPSRRPSAASVVAGLRAGGLNVAAINRAGVDARGSTPYFGTDADGRQLFIKVLGADERSADLLFQLYRRLMPHNLGDERPFNSLRREVEHEAMVALFAASHGVPTPPFVALTHADPNGFILVYEAVAGRSFDKLDKSELDDTRLRTIWGLVAELHHLRMAHRDLRLANLYQCDDGTTLLIDFGFAEVAASDLLIATDLAELLASTATVVGPERAVAAARSVVAADALAVAAARLRPWALSGATRAACKRDTSLLPALRAELASATTGSTLPR